MGNKKSDHRPPSLQTKIRKKKVLFLFSSLCRLLEGLGRGRTLGSGLSHCFARTGRYAGLFGVDIGVKAWVSWFFHSIKS